MSKQGEYYGVKRCAIILGVSVIVLFGASLVLIYPNSPVGWCILGVPVFLVLARNLNWLVSRISKPHVPSDPVYLELRALFREKLLPLNFLEEESYSLGDYLVYTRGQSKISMGETYRDSFYYFRTSNPDFQISLDKSEGEQFKAEVLEKFEEWLAKQ